MYLTFCDKFYSFLGNFNHFTFILYLNSLWYVSKIEFANGCNMCHMLMWIALFWKSRDSWKLNWPSLYILGDLQLAMWIEIFLTDINWSCRFSLLRKSNGEFLFKLVCCISPWVSNVNSTKCSDTPRWARSLPETFI